MKDSIKGSVFYPVAKKVLYFLYLPLALLLYACNVRLMRVTTPDRIGHLSIEPDCFIKEKMLGLRRHFVEVLLAPRHAAANEVLLDLWKRLVPVVTSTFVCRLMSPLLQYSFIKLPAERYAIAINETAACASILAKWENRPPLLKKEWINSHKGMAALHALGMPIGSWFVCVHSRDGHYSLVDEHLHSYRNSSIENYFLAMRAIVERGGWCIRVGEPTPSALPTMPGIIDYANSDEKSDWMDVFLCANCRFFLGNSSGLYLLATVFGVHSALANQIPVSGALPVGRGDLGIPKLLRSKASGQLLSYRDILSTPVGNFRYAHLYEESDITVEENSPEDIRDLAIEMLDRLSGTETSNATDEQLQRKFQQMLQPGHYSFGADSRIGTDFLRKYARLL